MKSSPFHSLSFLEEDRNLASRVSADSDRAPTSVQPPSSREPCLPQELALLRIELIELACSLDRRGNPAAADVAMFVSARLQEMITAAQRPSEVSIIQSEQNAAVSELCPIVR